MSAWSLALRTSGDAAADSALFGYHAPTWTNEHAEPFGNGSGLTLTVAFMKMLVDS